MKEKLIILFLVLSALIATGCQTSQPERWMLSSGEQIICLYYNQTECGLSLRRCGEDRTVDFECVTDAKYLGPGEYFEPEIYDEPSKEPPKKEKCK